MSNKLENEVKLHAAYMDSQELKRFLQREQQKLGELYIVLEKLEPFEKEFGIGASNKKSEQIHKLMIFLGRPDKKEFKTEQEFYNALDEWEETDAANLAHVLSDDDFHVSLLDNIDEAKQNVGKIAQFIEKALTAVSSSMKYTGPTVGKDIIDVKPEEK
jgi:hypothetical protein